MPVEAQIFVTAVVVMFVVFMAAVAYGQIVAGKDQ
jgi:hypothetical protein